MPGDSSDRFQKRVASAFLRQARACGAHSQQAFETAGGRCECIREARIPERCSKTFLWDERTTSDEQDGWQANHRQSEVSGGADSSANCEILCVPCHKNTKSYGRAP